MGFLHCLELVVENNFYHILGSFHIPCLDNFGISSSRPLLNQYFEKFLIILSYLLELTGHCF